MLLSAALALAAAAQSSPPTRSPLAPNAAERRALQPGQRPPLQPHPAQPLYPEPRAEREPGPAVQAGPTGPTGPSSGCASPTLCGIDILGPIAARLQAARGGAGVHILQIGDSHTAGDMISSAARGRLQARYGAGGRGVLAGGRPYQGYLTFGVTASSTPGWSVNAIFGNRYNASGPPIGLSGFTQTARSAGERLGVSTDSPDQNFDRLIVCAVTGPNAGGVVIQMGGRDYLWQLDQAGYGASCRTMDNATPVSSASITTLDDRQVSITSFGMFRRSGGVVWSNVGVVGSQLLHFGRTSDTVVGEELRAYRPDLVILAYGTNEGFSPSISIDTYEANLRAQVARLRRFLGRGTPILLMGAPDAASRSLAGTGCGNGTSVPNALGRVRQVQRSFARENGLAFFDWERAMGGACASASWQAQGLMRSDFVHFTRDGGGRIGSQLAEDLQRVPPSPSFQHPDPRREPVTPTSSRRRP